MYRIARACRTSLAIASRGYTFTSLKYPERPSNSLYYLMFLYLYHNNISREQGLWNYEIYEIYEKYEKIANTKNFF